VPRNAYCQFVPSGWTKRGIMSGARTAPTFVPAFNMPVAKARSRRGNHSATVFIAAGKFPDSPSPRPKRATQKPTRLKAGRTSACIMPKKLHMAMDSA